MNEQKRTIQRKNEKMRCNENMKACEQRRSVEVYTHPSNPTIHPYPSLNYFTACSTFINQSSSEFLLKFKGKINKTMERCCLIAPCHLCRRLLTVSFFFLVSQAKRAGHENYSVRAAALVPRARPPLTKSEEKRECSLPNFVVS